MSSDFVTQKRIFFWREGNKSLIAQITAINGKPYVGLSKFWRQSDWRADRWAPSKKGHLYMTQEQWKSLLAKQSEVTNLLADLQQQLDCKD